MKNVLKVSLVVAISFAMVACKTNAQYNTGVANATAAGNSAGYANGQAAGDSNGVKVGNLALALEKQYGATYNFEMVKFGQDNANYAVIKVSGAENFTMAIDISSYTTGTSWSAFLPTTSVFAYLTANSNGTYSCVSGTCQQAGNGAASTTMTFEKTAGSVKDLEKVAALSEAFQVETLASNIASEFGLSDDRSIKVAQLAASWNKLSKTRALTEGDADAFTKELAGVSMADMDNAEKAAANGSGAELSAVLAKAAAVNGTTSENMSSIMMKLFSN